MGALVVHGTREADVISVSLSPDDATKIAVTVNGRSLGNFDAAGAKLGVMVHAGRGDDVVFVDDSYGDVPVPVMFDGGKGNDAMATGAAGGVLFGGDGNDTLIGGQANDVLHGQHGDDFLTGGYGDDLLVGGPRQRRPPRRRQCRRPLRRARRRPPRRRRPRRLPRRRPRRRRDRGGGGADTFSGNDDAGEIVGPARDPLLALLA
jgi:Ca2+-binding RTX toxin-like protein